MLNKNLKLILSAIVIIATVYFAVCWYAQNSDQSGVVVQKGSTKIKNGHPCKGNNNDCQSGYCSTGNNKTCEDKPA